MMDQDVKTKWVDALRSGDFEQGQTYLCSDGNYCCLGVLCEIAELPKTKLGTRTYYYFDHETFVKSDIYLPDDYFGLSEDNIGVLIGMNDSDCNTFPEIADYIEANL